MAGPFDACASLGAQRKSELGFTLIEALVAVGIVALALTGVFFASATVARFGTTQSNPRRDAAALLAEQTLRTAADSWKYAAPGVAAPQLDGAWQSGPYTVTVATTKLATPAPNDPTRQTANVHVTVSYTPEAQRSDSGSVSAQTTLRVKAPVPGTTLDSG